RKTASAEPSRLFLAQTFGPWAPKAIMPEAMVLTANGWLKQPDSLCGRIDQTEAHALRLQEELTTVLRGLAALKERVRDADDLSGEPQSENLRREIDEVLRRQGLVLEEMVRSAETFPRRWAEFELNTSQRKSLMLSIKARKARDQAVGIDSPRASPPSSPKR
ncbi:unnamed protein product, partial [Effrenium voratum]